MNDNCKHEMVGTFPRVCMKCGMESFEFRASVYLEHAQRQRALFHAAQISKALNYRRSAELKIYEEPSSEEAPKCKKRYRSIDDPWEV